MNGRLFRKSNKKFLVSFQLKIVIDDTYKNSDNNGIINRVSNIPPAIKTID
jgi:hypothetical protein